MTTEQKEAAADALRVVIRSMMVRVKQVFKTSSATYKGFGTKELDEITENDLVRCGHRVVRLATKYLPKLGIKGVNPANIAALGMTTSVLDEAIDTQDTANRVRNESTQERVEMANALYAIIVELFDFGKDHWYTRNEAKYNDYIIYDTPGGGSTPPGTNPTPTPTSNTVEGTVAAGTTANVLSNLSPTATVKVSNNGISQFVVCITANATDACAIGTTVNPNETVTLGGPESTTNTSSGQYLNITNNDPMNEAMYSVTVTA